MMTSVNAAKSIILKVLYFEIMMFFIINMYVRYWALTIPFVFLLVYAFNNGRMIISKISKIYFWTILFIFSMAMLHIFFSESDVILALETFFYSMSAFLLTVCLDTEIQDELQYIKLKRIVIITVTVISIIGIIDFFGWVSIPGVNVYSEVMDITDFGKRRITSTFGAPNGYGAILAFTLLLLFSSKDIFNKKLIKLFLYTFIIGALIITESRGSMLIVFLGGIVYTCCSLIKYRKIKYVVSFIFLFWMLFFIFKYLLNNGILNLDRLGFNNINDIEKFSSGRSYLLTSYLSKAKEAIFWGNGNVADLSYNGKPQFSHNTYVQVLYEGGIGPLILYLYLIFIMFYRSIKVRSEKLLTISIFFLIYPLFTHNALKIIAFMSLSFFNLEYKFIRKYNEN